MYHLKGNDESFSANVVFNEIEFLNQKLWPFKEVPLRETYPQTFSPEFLSICEYNS